MRKKQKRQLLALCGGMCGAAYLTAEGVFPNISDFLAGGLLGLAMTLFILALLPETARQKLKRWKGRG